MPLILYVEYHSAVRQAASYIFDQEPDLEVVSQASSVAEGRQKMAQGGHRRRHREHTAAR
jgi:DNA-binding NarL/FixJ family response regulator